jgi:hypothetical protein
MLARINNHNTAREKMQKPLADGIILLRTQNKII